MALVIQLVSATILGWVVLRWYRHSTRRRRQRYIDSYRFHPAIKKKVQEKHTHLDEAALDLVFQGLRDYFTLCNHGSRRLISMPSQVVDDAWHEFILFTRAYQTYCQKALGRFLHHVPAEAMRTPTLAQDGIKRAWRLACHQANINPRHPDRLPLLFEIDTRLNIRNGFKYSLNCQALGSGRAGDSYCASHISCASGCGGGCGGDSSDGGSSGCGGGCGGGD